MQPDIEEDRSNNGANSYPKYNVCVDILTAIAGLSHVLLSSEDLDCGVNEALKILGTSVKADRLNILKHQEDLTDNKLDGVIARYEWLFDKTNSQIHHPELRRIAWDRVENCDNLFCQGKYWGGLIETLDEPFRKGQLKRGVKATYAIPIMVKEKYWGIIVLDFCKVARKLEDGEIEVLKTAVTCIGSAIERDRIYRERERIKSEASLAKQTSQLLIERERVRRQQEQAERHILLERQKAKQLEKYNEALAKRDREVRRSYCLLEITASAANIISTEKNFDNAINNALQIIGESTDTDRVSIMEHFEHPSEQYPEYVKTIYEWDSAYAISQLNHPEVNKVSYEGIEDWYELMCQGKWAGGLVDELPEPFRSKMKVIDVKSTYAIPILVEGKYWGIIGIDNCRQPAKFNEAEINILKTLAACIGGAIEKERSRCAKEEAEKTILLEREKAALEQAVSLMESNKTLSLRDRWLDATANAANKLLQIADLDAGINAALKVLGESLNCDRVNIMQHHRDRGNEFVRMLYEWDSPHAISQISHPKLNKISAEGIEDWFATLKAGGWIGGTIDELREPFRSGQRELGVKATYSVPIFVNRTYWGAICVDFCREPRQLTTPEIAVFKTAASCIGSAIYRQRIQTQRENAERKVIRERVKATQEKTTELAKVNAVLNQSLINLADSKDLNLFLSQVLREISQQTKATMGHIFLYDAPTNTLAKRLSIWHGEIHQGVAEYDCQLFQKPFSADITPGFQHLCQTRDVDILSTSDNSDLELWWPGTLKWHRQMGHQEAIAVALMLGDTPLGLLGLGFTAKIYLKPEKSDLIRALSNQAAIAIQLTKLAEQTKKSALTIERNRMAREIHDTLAQAFTGISLQLEAASNILATQPETARDMLFKAKKLAKEGITEARRSVRALRPETLEANSLAIALQQLVYKMTSDVEIEAKVIIEGESQLSPDIEVDLYRIAQEAVTNTLRHARATELTVCLICQADTISLQIRDNGIGFDPQRLLNSSFGLIGMQERCDRHKGKFEIDSTSDRGTKIMVQI